jgi:hypothetical protein
MFQRDYYHELAIAVAIAFDRSFSVITLKHGSLVFDHAYPFPKVLGHGGKSNA